MVVAQEFPDVFTQAKYLLSLKIFDSIHWQLDAGFYKNDFNEKKFSKFVLEYNQSVSRFINYWVKEMKDFGKVLRVYPFVAIMDSLLKNESTKLRCGSGYAGYSIDTAGNLSPCPIMGGIKNFYCGNLNSKISELKNFYVDEPCNSCSILEICGGRCLYSNQAKLWPEQGEKLICKTVIHLIKELKRVLPEVRRLIEKGRIKKTDFEYEKYFGPEIIP